MNILQIVTVSAKKKTLQIYALNEDRFVSRKDINVPDQVVAMVSELYWTHHYIRILLPRPVLEINSKYSSQHSLSECLCDLSRQFDGSRNK